MMSGLIGVILFALGLAAAVLILIFILVPVLKGLAWLIGNLFKGIGWFVHHIFSFIFGMIGDTVRSVGALIAMIVLAPLVPINVIIGRWSAAGHFAEAIKRECKVFVLCIYRVVLQRPLKLVLLHGILEGIEQRVPEAMAGAPTSDKPSRRTGTFDGYTIVGSLRGGGSGGKLYIAQPNGSGRTARRELPDRVVIKSFALTEGSSLPQIVRESRALEAARNLGLVLDHSMDEHRFWYVMPYHAGENLGVITRQLHGESGDRGLTPAQLPRAAGYLRDLLSTVHQYHRGGLWHKDIKPENIIINDGRANLVDLGLVTPLRSAMTLTTHGTEYFRDPEMVRMALRGVKVHQVDGAKFDIYAVGAVLYFMLENTFPAHGGLSRFARRSPEALRWVVRRAMADYNKRYESVAMMLADMDTVMQARDPFTVKPADLPSMNGSAVNAADFDLDQDSNFDGAPVGASAGSPRPPINKNNDDGDHGYAVAAGFGAMGPFAKVHRLDFGDGNEAAEQDPANPTKPRRPALRVTNWWTGKYNVDFADSAHGQHPAGPAVAAQVRHASAQGAAVGQRTAREQIRAARTRVREMRNRAASRRNSARAHVRSHAERQPSAGVILTTLIVLGGIAFVAIMIAAGFMRRSNSGDMYVRSSTTTDGTSRIQFADNGPPMIVLSDVHEPDNRDVQVVIREIVEQWRSTGYDVVTDDSVALEEMSGLYANWKNDPNGAADDAIEDAMERYNYYGILHIEQIDHPGFASQGISPNAVWSERRGAKQRRRVEPVATVPAVPMLLINDHPARTDPDVEHRIAELKMQSQQQGYELVINDDLEVVVRRMLPIGSTEPIKELSAALSATLLEKQLGGIVRITARPGQGDAASRLQFERVLVNPTLVLPPQPETATINN